MKGPYKIIHHYFGLWMNSKHQYKMHDEKSQHQHHIQFRKHGYILKERCLTKRLKIILNCSADSNTACQITKSSVYLCGIWRHFFKSWSFRSQFQPFSFFKLDWGHKVQPGWNCCYNVLKLKLDFLDICWLHNITPTQYSKIFQHLALAF